MVVIGVIVSASSLAISLNQAHNDKEKKENNIQQKKSSDYNTTLARLQSTHTTELRKAKILFAQFNGTKIQFFTMQADGTNIKEVVTGDAEEAMKTNDPDNHLKAKLSPDGTTIAYKVAPQKNYTAAAPADLAIIDIKSESKKVIAQKVEKFFWSPDSKNIVYSTNTPPISVHTNAKEIIEESILGPGSEWYLYDITTSQQNKLQFKNTFYNNALYLKLITGPSGFFY